MYAEIFPTKVRAIVLDGAVDPQQSPVEASEGQAMGFERALDNFTAWCKTSTARCPIAADPKGAINAALDKARTAPVKASDGRVATAGWILWGVIFAMYSQDSWQYVGPAINNLSRGDPTLIFAMADSYAERDQNGHYSNLFDANNAVNCADADYPTVDEIRGLQSQWRTKYPTLRCDAGDRACSTAPFGRAKRTPIRSDRQRAHPRSSSSARPVTRRRRTNRR